MSTAFDWFPAPAHVTTSTTPANVTITPVVNGALLSGASLSLRNLSGGDITAVSVSVSVDGTTYGPTRSVTAGLPLAAGAALAIEVSDTEAASYRLTVTAASAGKADVVFLDEPAVRRPVTALRIAGTDAGGTSLPTATGAGEVPVSTGAGTTYTATSAGAVVATGLSAALSEEVVGTAVIADGDGSVSFTSADVSAMLASANAAAARTALGVASVILGHRWERPAPASVPAGSLFIDTDDLSEQVSSGLAVSAGVAASGWMRRLPSGLGDGRAALAGIPRAYVDWLDLSAYTIGAASLAVLWTWDGTQPSNYGFSEVVTFGDRDNVLRGIHVDYVTNGANTDLVVYSGGVEAGKAVLLASANLVAGAVGLHALAIAPVNASGHKWRFSLDGSAVADVAMGTAYVPPYNIDSIGVGARPDGLIYLNGRFVELAVWNSLLSNADLLALSTLPGTPTYELPESSSTGAAAIRVQACRYDPATAATLPAKGVAKQLTVASSTSKVTL